MNNTDAPWEKRCNYLSSPKFIDAIERYLADEALRQGYSPMVRLMTRCDCCSTQLYLARIGADKTNFDEVRATIQRKPDVERSA